MIKLVKKTGFKDELQHRRYMRQEHYRNNRSWLNFLCGMALLITAGMIQLKIVTNVIGLDPILAMLLGAWIIIDFLFPTFFMSFIFCMIRKPRTIIYRIKDEGILGQIFDKSDEALCPWNAVGKAKRCLDGFMILYNGTENSIWLPHHAIQPPHTADELANLLEAHVPGYEDQRKNS